MLKKFPNKFKTILCRFDIIIYNTDKVIGLYFRKFKDVFVTVKFYGSKM